MTIKEIIVVEGRSDTNAINKAIDADTIETNGSAINQQTINAILLAQEKRGIIVFTDPDYPGERIRKIISQAVPGCKHAFLTKKQAFGGAKNSLGVEHASPQAIIEALKNVYTESVAQPEVISWQVLIRLGLIGGNEAQKRRARLGEELKIGYTNGKQFYKRLKMFQITEDEFYSAFEHALIQEEVSD